MAYDNNLVLYTPGNLGLCAYYAGKIDREVFMESECYKNDKLEYPDSELMTFESAWAQIQKQWDSLCGDWVTISKIDFESSMSVLPPSREYKTSDIYLYRHGEPCSSSYRSVYLEYKKGQSYAMANYCDRHSSRKIIEDFLKWKD